MSLEPEPIALDAHRPTSSRLAVLLFTDIVGSTDLKSRLGTTAYTAQLARHDALFRSLTARVPGAAILQDTGDGFFASFLTASDAVRGALDFHARLASDGASSLGVRVGIHVGEVVEIADEASGR